MYKYITKSCILISLFLFDYNVDVFTLSKERTMLCIPVPICPLVKIENGVSNCSTHDGCQVNSTMEYSCNPGYVSATPTTKCLKNHQWDPTPKCSPSNNLTMCFRNISESSVVKVFSIKPYFTYVYV